MVHLKPKEAKALIRFIDFGIRFALPSEPDDDDIKKYKESLLAAKKFLLSYNYSVLDVEKELRALDNK